MQAHVLKEQVNLTRLKRFNYEDTHEWPDDDNMEYDFDENGSEGQDLTLAEEIGLNWQKVGVRLVFMAAGVCFILLLCLCCGKIMCRTCCYSLKKNLVPCSEALEYCSACYEDPVYKRAREMAELFGLKLDYATYLKIRDRVEMEADGQFNPFSI